MRALVGADLGADTAAVATLTRAGEPAARPTRSSRRAGSPRASLRRLLRGGRNVLLHCRGGLGRSGTIAARLLVELGENPRVAIDRARRVRAGASETPAQEAHVLACVATGRGWREDGRRW